jgi:hypothetical protein
MFYVLIRFPLLSDTENLTTGRETRDWMEMIGWMRDITVNGGDDCPEYALSGLLKGISLIAFGFITFPNIAFHGIKKESNYGVMISPGIEMSNRRSKIYLCTDASAKDPEKVTDLIQGLKAKSLTPVFLLTGSCDDVGWEYIKTLGTIQLSSNYFYF